MTRRSGKGLHWVGRLIGIFALFTTSAACNVDCRTVGGLHLPDKAKLTYGQELPADVEHFSIVGDLQRTSFQECMMGREVNDEETRYVVAKLVADEPEFIAIVGDMVFEGSSETHWRLFDQLFSPIQAAGISVLPLLGNHEVYGADGDAFGELHARFPRLREGSYYADQTGPLGLVWLDSTLSKEADWQRQALWYAEILEAFDTNPGIDGVLIFLHHPPITRSPWVDGDVRVQEAIVPPFLESKKTLAMITGHAHGYEHYRQGFKHLIITAGGGGPRPTSLAPLPESGWQEVYLGPGPRPFNYLDVRVSIEFLEITVKGIQKGESSFEEIESISLPWYGHGSLQ